MSVALYEMAGVDKYGVQKWKCLCGTIDVEGGPHGDIYRKFGALIIYNIIMVCLSTSFHLHDFNSNY